jgi:tRNA(Ile)-lysidine synthase
MLPAGSRVLAAVSGGPDSVCLVHLLRDLGLELAGIAHFNHQLRGQESEDDQRFVARLAQALHLPFYCEISAVPAGNLEQNARRARREFFRRLISEGKADRVALGHTRDDQAETVLFRILRGAGPTGLAGILPVSAEGLIRPLIDVRREDVLAYLRDRDIPWREDSSNVSLAFARNRIRHELLPRLQQTFNPQLVDALAHLADVSFEEETWWAAEVARVAPQVLSETRDGLEIATEALRSLAPALQRRLVRQAIRQAKGDLRGIDYRHVEAILKLAASPEGSGRLTLPGAMGIRSFDRMLLSTAQVKPQPAALLLSLPGVYRWPCCKPLIEMELIDIPAGPGPGDTLRVDLEVRGWLPGDRYQPEGHAHPVRLKELFQRARVPSWQRASWPILTKKDKILWVKQFGPAADLPSELEKIQIREIRSEN